MKKLFNTQAILTTALTAVIMMAVTSVTPVTVSTVYAAPGSGQAAESASEKVAEQKKPAKKQAANKKKRRVKRAQTMRPKIFKKLDKVRELADAKDYNGAIEALASVEKIRRNSYETAMTHNMYAYVYFNQENYGQAVGAYKNVLAGKNIPDSLLQTTTYSIAKLYLIQEDYKQALGSLNDWFTLVEKPGPEAHILRAQIFYQLEKFEKALPDVKQAIAMTKAQGNKPRENWLLMERAVYYQNKDYQSMERCLKDLIALYPKAQYWVQLSAVYNELGKPEAELATLETAYDQKLLAKEAQVVSLAQAMLSKEIPYKAAQVLLQGMKEGVVEESAKNLSLLGDALMIAKEYDQAIVVMKKAADASQQGKDFYKLAQIHTERQEWDLGLSSVNKALKLGELNAEHSALILKGLILFNMDRLAEAKVEFDKAHEFEVAEKMAKQWLSYIDSEEQRRAYMAAN